MEIAEDIMRGKKYGKSSLFHRRRGTCTVVRMREEGVHYKCLNETVSRGVGARSGWQELLESQVERSEKSIAF